jgi:hypothetical protein
VFGSSLFTKLFIDEKEKRFLDDYRDDEDPGDTYYYPYRTAPPHCGSLDICG